MNIKNFNKILSYYEDFKLYKGKFKKDLEFTANGSLHSEISTFAYGKIKTAKCADISADGVLLSKVILKNKDINCRNFYLKLTACLFDWKKHYNDITIYINDNFVYENPREFFENVNLGWPTIYIPIAPTSLKVGKNIIKISTKNSSGGGLLIERADLLSLPSPEEGAQISVQKSARCGQIYTIAFNYKGNSGDVIEATNCKLIDIKKPDLFPNVLLFRFISHETGEAKAAIKFDGGTLVEAAMPCIYKASPDNCLVGTDSGDHRHDNSDETDRIMHIFQMEAMGSYFQLRPLHFRNFLDLSPMNVWEKRIDYLKMFGTKISLADGGGKTPYVPTLAGENYVGSHTHEPYLYFYTDIEDFDPNFAKQRMINKKALLSSDSFKESRQMYTDVLRKTAANAKSCTGLASVGSPSLLCVYEAAAGFERVTMEPVSNINLLIGAVRASTNKIWGSHVPVDWYFGDPNDGIKSKKFLLALQLLYINGADYIYTENAIFKINAFSREDWEDEFCTKNREYLREFYDYTIKNPREGELIVDQAVVYGNNEYFMWHYDDRIAELADNHDWDIKVWGKWDENEHQKCWRAIDAWLPVAENQKSYEGPLNLNLFSGMPYGATNVIPYESDYNKYRSLAFLEWNTWEDSLASKLSSYVKNGGHLFISLCHFNKTDRSDMPMEFATGNEIEDFLGLTFKEDFIPKGTITFKDGKTIEINEDILVKNCETTEAEVIACDSEGRGIIYKRKLGKGVLYFGAFAQYFSKAWGVRSVKHMLTLMAEENASIVCDNKNIAAVMRKKENGDITLNIINTCVADSKNKNQQYCIKVKGGGKIFGKVPPCTIDGITLSKNIK